MLTTVLFDERSATQCEDWQGSLAAISPSELLWIDASKPEAEELTRLAEWLPRGADVDVLAQSESGRRARLSVADETLHVAAMAAPRSSGDAVAVECLVGGNWMRPSSGRTWTTSTSFVTW